MTDSVFENVFKPLNALDPAVYSRLVDRFSIEARSMGELAERCGGLIDSPVDFVAMLVVMRTDIEPIRSRVRPMVEFYGERGGDSESLRDDLVDRVAEIALSKGVSVVARSRRLQRQFERYYVSSRSIVDLRFLFPNREDSDDDLELEFEEDGKVKPLLPMQISDRAVGVVAAELCIEYEKSNADTETFHVGLTIDDLEDLRDTVNRALAKADGVQETLDGMDANYVESMKESE